MQGATQTRLPITLQPGFSLTSLAAAAAPALLGHGAVTPRLDQRLDPRTQAQERLLDGVVVAQGHRGEGQLAGVRQVGLHQHLRTILRDGSGQNLQ